MTHAYPTPTMENRRQGIEPPPLAAGDALEELAADAGGLERIARELLADPCQLVRRACQLADYETVAAEGRADETTGA